VSGELAAMRVPDLDTLAAAPASPTLREAVARWRESRVDVTEGTRVLHRVALNRVLPTLGDLRVDEITVERVNALVTELAAGGSKRETIRKSVKYLAAVLDDHGVTPNPARDRRIRLPHEEHAELVPPTATHVLAVLGLMPSAYRLPLLWLDWSGARVGSIDALLVGDYDEPGRRLRLRASTTKTRAALWVDLPRRARRRARGDPAATRGPEPGRATVPRRHRRPAQDGDRPRLQGERHPGVLAP
jgi:hypothetical protein